MANAVDPTLIEEIVGAERHATDHIVRLHSAEQKTYILHSAECLTEMGTPAEDCAYTAAQDKGILDNWDGCEDQPVVVDIDEDEGLLTPRWIEIDEADRFKPGARVRVKRGAADVGDGHPGAEYVIESYVDKKHRDMPLPYYMVDDPEGNMIGGCVPHAALEQTATPEEQAEASKMPEPEDVMKAVSSSLHHLFGDGEMEIYETSLLKESSKEGEFPEGGHPFTHGVEFVGKTSGGRRFAGTLRLTSLYPADY